MLLNSGGSSRSIKFLAGGLFCLAVCVFGYVYFSSSQPVSPLPLTGAPGQQASSNNGSNNEGKKAEHVHDANCGHNHSGYRQPGSNKPLPQYPVTAFSEIPGQGSVSVRESKRGDRFELKFGDVLSLDVRVTGKQDFPGQRQTTSMSLIGRDGHVHWLESADGSVIGNVTLKEDGKNQVYRFSGGDADWQIQEIAFQEYICSNGASDENIGMPASQAPFSPAGTAVIIPLLNSLPGAEAVVYIDFDGEDVSGTRWVNGGTINAEPSGFDEQQIRDCWEEVAEDMRPFKVNVTTDRAVFDAAAQNKKMMCIVTPTNDAAPGAGGVAYLNSFYDGSVDPCWCFNLSGDSAGITVSHEIGHTFGLFHDGLTSQNDPEYHFGNGTWGPIMGAPFFSAVRTWSIGDYEGSTNTEDDLAIINSRSANYRDDDYGNTSADGFDLSGNVGDEAVEVIGIIERTSDVDVFRFKTSGGDTSLSATPTSAYPNMNISVQLYDQSGTLVVESDPADSYAASVETNLGPGNYSFHVTGTGDGSPDVAGFTDYGSLGEYGVSGNVGGLGGVIVDITQPALEEVSIGEGNGLYLAATTTGKTDFIAWLVSEAPAGGVATFSAPSATASRVTFSQPGIYTLTFRAGIEGIFSDASLRVSVEKPGTPKEFENRGPVIRITSPDEFYAREGQLRSSVTDDGVPVSAQPAAEWIVVSGTARVLNSTSVNPTVRFKDNKPSILSLESSDGQIRTFKRITVRSLYEVRELVTAGTPGRWAIPTASNDFLDSDPAWASDGFDDSGWSEGTAAIGYDVNNEFSQFLISGTNIKPAMQGVSPSACLRIPFTVPDVFSLQDLTLRIHYNDAFVAYLNGVEVARRNLSGSLPWDATALSTRSLQDLIIPDEINLTSAIADNLKAGENILAIRGLNDASGDGRFLIHPELRAGVIGQTYRAFTNRYGADMEPLGDDDGDQLLNIAEHALGTNPLEKDALDPVSLQPDGSIKLSLPEQMPDDVDYILEKSEDLSKWTQIASKNGSEPWVGVSVNVEEHGITDGQAIYAVAAPSPIPSEIFYRLRYSIGSLDANP